MWMTQICFLSLIILCSANRKYFTRFVALLRMWQRLFLFADDRPCCVSSPTMWRRLPTLAWSKLSARSTKSLCWRWTPTRPSENGLVYARLIEKATPVRLLAALALPSQIMVPPEHRLMPSLMITSRASKWKSEMNKRILFFYPPFHGSFLIFWK